MDRAVRLLNSYVADDRAVTAIEYGLIAGIITLAILTVITQIGINLQAVFNQAASF